MNRFFTKRNLILAGLLIVALAIAACAPAAQPTAAPPTAAPVQPTAVPAQPTAVPAQPTAVPAQPTAVPQPTEPPAASGAGACGTLRLLWWQAPTILNPHLAQGTKDYDASRLVYLPLAAVGPDGLPDASVGLAAEVPTAANGGVAADGTSITWKLKSGLKWQDGTPFTADDVIFTWKYASDTATAATTAQSFADIKDIEKIDDTTIKITWNQPTATPYVAFVGPLGMVLPKHVFEAHMGAGAAQAPANLAPVAIGPYKVKEFKPGDVVTYEINENFWAADKLCFGEVNFKGGGDATSAARAAVETGDVDYAWNLQVPADVLSGLAASGKGEVISGVSGNLERLLLNRTDPDPALGDMRSEPVDKGGKPHPFLSDLKVRQALALAMDRESMGKIYGGRAIAGEGTCNVITAPPALVSTTDNGLCEYNLEKANALLDEAGWTRGSDGIREKTVDGKLVKMKVVYQTTVNAVRQAVQQIVKESWSQLGVDVELKSVDAGVFFSSDVANPDTAAKFFADVEMFTNGPAQTDDINYVRGWICDEVRTRADEWRGNNYERYCSAEYDAVIEELAAELDPAKRIELFKKANDILVSDVVVIPLVARNFPVAGKSKALKGVQANPWDGDLWNVMNWTNQ